MPVVRAHLDAHVGAERDALLFPAGDGRNMSPNSLYWHHYPARVAAGRPDLRFLDLRHTGAVLAASTGATLAELMARLGHSTPAAAMKDQHAAADRTPLGSATMASPDRPPSAVPSVIVGGLAAVSWLVAASGHLAWSLAMGGNLPTSLMGLTWPRGPVVWVRGGAVLVAIVLTAMLIQRLARRGWLTAVTCIPLLMAGSWVSATPYPGAAIAFEVWRPLFLQARDVMEPTALTVDSYYGPDLPDDLALLSSTGFVSIREGGSIFFSQWSGIPDDAGGYWYLPGDGSPDGWDMWGMTCAQPLSIEHHWWSCGIDEDAGGRW